MPFNMSPNQCFYHKYHTPTPPSFLSFLMQRMFTLLDIYRMRTDVLGFFSLSLQREFHCFTEKAIWNVTGSEVRVKWKTAVIMSAGQHSRERNFFQSLGHGSRGVGGGIFFALKLIGLIFFCGYCRLWLGELPNGENSSLFIHSHRKWGQGIIVRKNRWCSDFIRISGW